MAADNRYDVVHEKTRLKAGVRYGCFDKPRSTIGYYAPDRQYRPDGTFVVVMKFIHNVMSKPCRYDLWQNDSRCKGCDVPKDFEYTERMRGMK